MWVSDQGCAAIDAEFLVVLLMASARASGVGCDDIEGDELTAICRSVKEVIRPDGESCPECSAPQGANSKIHTFNPGKILPELAHLLIDPKSPGTKQGHQVAELDAIEAAAWGDD